MTVRPQLGDSGSGALLSGASRAACLLPRAAGIIPSRPDGEQLRNSLRCRQYLQVAHYCSTTDTADPVEPEQGRVSGALKGAVKLVDRPID